MKEAHFTSHAFFERLEERTHVEPNDIRYLLNTRRYVPIRIQEGTCKVLKLVYLIRTKKYIVVVQDENDGSVITFLKIYSKEFGNGSVQRVLSKNTYRLAKKLARSKNVLNLRNLEKIKQLNSGLRLALNVCIRNTRQNFTKVVTLGVNLDDIQNFDDLLQDPCISKTIRLEIEKYTFDYFIEFVTLGIQNMKVAAVALNWFQDTDSL